MKCSLRMPTPSLVISMIALFVALGGTSYAAITALPANSVGTPQLKTNAVTSVKILNARRHIDEDLNGAVTAAKIYTTGLSVPKRANAAKFGGLNPNDFGRVAWSHTLYFGGSWPQGQARVGQRLDRRNRHDQDGQTQWGNAVRQPPWEARFLHEYRVRDVLHEYLAGGDPS